MTTFAKCALLLTALTLHATVAVAQAQRYAGRPLAEALRDLQSQGLRIVFSSAIVTPELRVTTEPRAAAPRQQLDELLAQHHLEVRDGPGGTLQVVRDASAKPAPNLHGVIDGWVVDAITTAPLARVRVRLDGHALDTRTDAAGRFVLTRVPQGADTLVTSTLGYVTDRRAVVAAGGQTVAVSIGLFPEPRHHNEYVSVTHSAPFRTDPGASEMTLDRSGPIRLDGSLAEDPLRSVHTFPRVTAVDEFRSDFAVRGNPFRQINLVVDGMPMEWLQHTAYGRGATGSIPMLSGRVLERTTLRSGAYPRRHGERLGSELDLALREGSRADVAFSGAIGGTDATAIGEGPIAEGRGSWLVAGRQSYLEWPPDRFESTRTAFGFSDGLVRVVFDVRRTQQLRVTALGGLSRIDGDDSVGPTERGSGSNRASAFGVSWRSTFGPALVVTQQAYVVGQRFLGRDSSGRASHRFANRHVAYRADLARAVPGGLLEAGAQVEQVAMTGAPVPADARGPTGTAWVRSGFAHFVWSATRSLTISPGVRLAFSTVADAPTLSRWLLTEWTFRPGWSVTGSAGISRQLPDPRHTLGNRGSAQLRSERARLFDLGLEWRRGRSVRWQVTVFTREEADILKEPNLHPRLESGAMVFPGPARYSSGLAGTSHGIELLVDRRSATGLAGWAAYTYGRTRQTDPSRAESYWSDFDQRHTFTLVAEYRFARTTRVGATFRASTGLPIPGFLAQRDGRLFVGETRNRVRLPPYSRLDLRVDRQYGYFGLRLTPFLELLNTLNRANLGVTPGSVHPLTGEAIGFTGALLPRRVSAGLVVGF